MKPDEVNAVLRVRYASGRRAGGNCEVKGFPETELLLQAAGAFDAVAPELRGPARRWETLTPYLPVRHRKRESIEEFLDEDVTAELRYRGYPPARVERVSPDEGLSDNWAREFRKHRLKEHRDHERRGLGLVLEFAEPVTGPLLLGQLSHFGFGIFTPQH
jgi:CRISPR-associated protein Csb2